MGSEKPTLLLSLCRLISFLLRSIWQLDINPIYRCIHPGLIYMPRTLSTELHIRPVPSPTRTAPVPVVLGPTRPRFLYTRAGFLHADTVLSDTITRNTTYSSHVASADIRILAVPKAATAEPVFCSRYVWAGKAACFLGGALFLPCCISSELFLRYSGRTGLSGMVVATRARYVAPRIGIRVEVGCDGARQGGCSRSCSWYDSGYLTAGGRLVYRYISSPCLSMIRETYQAGRCLPPLSSSAHSSPSPPLPLSSSSPLPLVVAAAAASPNLSNWQSVSPNPL